MKAEYFKHTEQIVVDQNVLHLSAEEYENILSLFPVKTREEIQKMVFQNSNPQLKIIFECFQTPCYDLIIGKEQVPENDGAKVLKEKGIPVTVNTVNAFYEGYQLGEDQTREEQ